jgi:uncharacterized protein
VIHPDTRLVTIDDHVGQGVVATRRIPMGTITWVLDDLDGVFAESEASELPECYQPMIDRWTFNDGRGQHVLCWDLGRFMNHSCESNCGGTEHDFEIALRDIETGEQLTNDYAAFHMLPRERFECHCGTASCRGLVTHGLFPDVTEALDHRVAVALAFVDRVDQPLAMLLRPGQVAAALSERRGA